MKCRHVLTEECVGTGISVFMFHLLLPLRLLADVDGESRPHHTEDTTQRKKSINSPSPSMTPGQSPLHEEQSGKTHRPFRALKSLMPSAGPQIWMTSSLVSFNRSAPAHNAQHKHVRKRFSLHQRTQTAQHNKWVLQGEQHEWMQDFSRQQVSICFGHKL